MAISDPRLHSMVLFMVKWAIESIPELIFLTIASSIVGFVLSAIVS